MAKGNKIYSYSEVTEESDISNLPLLERLRAMYFAWFRTSGREEAKRLKDMAELTRAELELKSDLLNFFNKALEPIRRGEARAVVVQIAKEFDPILDSVLISPKLSQYYHITILSRPKPDFNVKYTIQIRLEAKGATLR